MPGAFLFKNFLTKPEAQKLLAWARELEQGGQFKPAAIGKNELKQQNSEVRSDEICWLDRTDREESEMVFQIFSDLMLMGKRELLLPIKRFECHFAKYETGNRYLPHRDRHKKNPSRLLTCVLYLNDLSDEDGGTLVIYGNDGEKALVQPEAGTLVFFDSHLLHEVKPAFQPRWSLTGWMRDDLYPGLNL